MSRLGNRLKELRGSLSLLDVERGSGVPRFTISRYESGENIPSPEKLRQLAEFYEVPYSDIRQFFYADLLYSDNGEKEALLGCILTWANESDINKRLLLNSLHSDKPE